MTYRPWSVPEGKELERAVAEEESFSAPRRLGGLQGGMMINVQHFRRADDTFRRIDQIDRFDDRIYLLIEALIPLTRSFCRQ